MSKAYIIGSSAISAQPLFDRNMPEHIVAYDHHPLEAMMPDMARYIPALKARRMTRLVRLGVMAGLNAMERAGAKNPGAIIVGSGDGCKHSTERFLNNMIEHDEQVPDPTAFIGSTHNSAAGQIALALSSNVYNYTYLHRGLSFASALADGLLHLAEGTRDVLVGGMDVITPGFLITQRQSGLWRSEAASGTDLLNNPAAGSLAGEGSAFFVLDSAPRGEWPLEILATEMAFGTTGVDATELVHKALDTAGVRPEDIDLVVTGRNGDAKDDEHYDFVEGLFPKASIAAYKHLVGEYYTANALGTWFTCSALVNNGLPREFMSRPSNNGPLRTALLIDHFQGTERTAILLRSAWS